MASTFPYQSRWRSTPSEVGRRPSSAITKYQTKHQGVQFSVQVGNTASLVEALLAYETDLLLAHDPPPSEGIAELLSVMQPICAIVRSDHPLSGRNTLAVADLQSYPIAIGDQSFFSRHAIETVARRSKISLRIALEANSVRALRIFARETGAIYFQFEIGTRHDVASGEFRAIKLSDRSLAKNRLVLGSRAGRNLPIAALSFTEALKNSLLGRA